MGVHRHQTGMGGEGRKTEEDLGLLLLPTQCLSTSVVTVPQRQMKGYTYFEVSCLLCFSHYQPTGKTGLVQVGASSITQLGKQT